MTFLEYKLSRSSPQSGISERLKGWISAMKKSRQRRRNQRIDRQAFQSLLYLDDSTLADIGYEREDVVRHNRLPLDVNAALQLGSTRLRRRTP